MPYSTGSDDSGLGLRYFDYAHCLSTTTSSLTCSEEDDYHYPRDQTVFQQNKPPKQTRGGKNRKQKKRGKPPVRIAPRPASTPNSIGSSTCSSEDSLEEALFGCSDVVQVYRYFQGLLINVREQQKCFQEIAKVVGDADARWGAHGFKNGWKIDPTGCLAPSLSGESRFYEGFWSFPHPAVYLALLSNFIQEYLHFLRCVYPQVTNPTMPPTVHNQRLPFDEHHLPELHQRHHQSPAESESQMIRLLQMMQQKQQYQQRQLLQSSSDLGENDSIHNFNGAAWPAPGCHLEKEAKPAHIKPVHSQEFPSKQCYSAVVARSSCSSVSDAFSEKSGPTPALYSQKAAPLAYSSTERGASEPRLSVQQAPVPGKSENIDTRNGLNSCLPEPSAPHFPPLASSEAKPTDESQCPIAPSPPPSDPVDPSGQFEISKMDVLSEQIWHFHNKITQKESTLEKKLALRNMLYYAISPVFPMCGLYVVGSSLNGFGNDNSDMDLCLMITNKDLDQKTDAVVVLNMILSTLQRMEWVAHQKLILAKVPILRIKFAAPFNDITVDLNANNSVAIKNTHLLCYYSSFDWRVRPLVSIVKEWAKRKGINDANRSSFTSYSLVLMVIHYLQCGQPAILPSLQQKFPKRFNARADVRTLNVTQPLTNHELDWDYQDKSTLGELLLGFLKYFSTKFDYNSQAISIREGKLISRTQVTKSRNNYTNNVMWRSQWRCICIEEPFTFNNTAHSIYDEMVFNAIKKSFEEAHDELEKTRDIDCLLSCTPITAAPPIHGATAYIYDGVSREATLEAGALMHGRGSSSSGIQLSGSDSNISINSVELGPSSKHLNTINESEKENIQRPISSCSQHSQASTARSSGSRPYSRNRNRRGQGHGPPAAQTRQQ